VTAAAVSADRLQAYLRASAGRTRETSLIFPFALFFHRTDPLPFFSYAAPIDPAPSRKLRGALVAIRSAFARAGRRARFEHLEAFAPDLAPALEAAGFVLEARQTVMACSCDAPRPVPLIPGVVIERFSPSSSIDAAREFLRTQRLGFDPEDRRVVTDQEAATFLGELCEQAAFLARLNGEPIGAAMTTPCLDRLTELVGLATLPPFRRRGIGTALASAAVEAAAGAAEAVVLSAEDGGAERLYARLGFRPVGALLSFADPPPA
jgi:ribosomal protein S18 acetylase RimI-like enzyme